MCQGLGGEERERKVDTIWNSKASVFEVRVLGGIRDDLFSYFFLVQGILHSTASGPLVVSTTTTFTSCKYRNIDFGLPGHFGRDYRRDWSVSR